ncbi:TetR/AcrR family transcriptional regulator [Bifidobacterium platyrrhinorum]|uniref:TetR family transcriptional regulator n=1 Tax=Bifidobacterium platyrrhinorum TaxID=2661628 RepID=A0A6L9STE9_9BIFI|nr:TetR/AcrR family transcriptional regulator [Bifidobacterium platyrrhinorum]NEG55867.1 TetR family transcriptional regulator [Bifidobacterium platyrrhinorum]
MATVRQKRVRKSPEERRAEIAAAAVRLVGEKGYYGTSLKDVADEVGMSQPGLLHYIGNKEGLLSMLITDNYDVYGTPDDFMRSGLPGSDPERLLFPAYLRYLVRYNAQRRELVRLYMILESEAFGPDHPLREYFANRPEAVWEHYSKYPWAIPPELGSWEDAMRPVVRRCIEAMDGVQLRWMRNPPVDLYDEWLAFEAMIFPSPVWDNYR